MRGFWFSDCLYKAYHVNSHTQDHKSAIIKHIVKVGSGQKWRTWQGGKPVCLPRNRVPPDKPRGNTPPLPPCPDQIPIAKPTSPCTKVEIPTNNSNDMGIHPLHQSDASKLQRDISGKKINYTAPDPGNISQGKYSNTKACNDWPFIEGKLINTKVFQDQPSREGELMNTKIILDQQPW